MRPKPLTADELRERIVRITGYGELVRRAWVDDWLAECGAGHWYWSYETVIVYYGNRQDSRMEPIHIPDRGWFYSVDALRQAAGEARRSA